MTIDYDHDKNLYTLESPRRALPILFPAQFPRTVLDVGCGTGTWLRIAMNLGAQEVFGVDGVPIAPESLLFDPQFFKAWDLTTPLDLHRRFDAVLCLEVAEHLDATFAPTLIDTLTRHSDCVVFSAACPDQPGQHHVNCRWPDYWQDLFNQRGYACDDKVRWQIWKQPGIEPWYRQNMFLATRRPDLAGREPRILPVIHPDMAKLQLQAMPVTLFSERLKHLSIKQYPMVFARATWWKVRQRL